jgi:hypothetical protein
MSTRQAGSEFWTEREKYHELAKAYEQNIEVTHPSGASCFCGENCPWSATTVTYFEYNGPKL